MTTVTDREIPARINGTDPPLDSPAVRASAHARIPVTQSADKISGLAGSIRSAVRSWWGFSARPLSLHDLWRLSGFDTKRVPGNSGGLATAWKVSNWTDRLVMFALIAILPTAFTGPLRWLAQRPTRRWGLYIVATILVALYALGRG